MNDFFKEKRDELGYGGIVLVVVMLGACASAAIWLAVPFWEGVTGIPSFILLSILYMLALSIILFPVIAIAGVIGNLFAFLVEGILALYQCYKRV